MKIVHAKAEAYRIAPSVPWEDATHKVSGIEWIVVIVTADNGCKGTGISYTVGIGGTAIHRLLEDYVLPMLVGKDPRDTEAVWTHLFQQLHRCGSGVTSLALAAVDIAIWDLLGVYYRQPLYKLLGGARSRVQTYASGIDFHLDLPALLDRIDEYISEGYQHVKIKIGKHCPEEDWERVVKVKEKLGPGRRLYVDANQKWDAAEAIQRCRHLDRFDLGWLEEPAFSDDVDGHCRLRQSMTTPLAIGESLYNKYQFLEFLKRDAVDIVQADVARVGGITEWMKIAHLADAWRKPVAPHFLMELSVHLLCSVPNGFILENVKGGSLSDMGVLLQPITVVDGYCTPSDEPGHGIRLDFDKLQPYKIDSGKLQNMDLTSSKL